MKQNVDLTLNRDFRDSEIPSVNFSDDNRLIIDISVFTDSLYDDIEIPWKSRNQFTYISNDQHLAYNNNYGEYEPNNEMLTGNREERDKKRFYASEYDSTICYCCGNKLNTPWNSNGRVCKACIQAGVLQHTEKIQWRR